MTKLIALVLAISVAACMQPSPPARDNVSAFPHGGGPEGPSGGAIIDASTWAPRASDSGWTY